MKKTLIRSSIVLFVIAFQVACGSNDPSPADAPGTQISNAPRNVLLIVADDLGYSDLGAFGGEIDTPNLDALAMSGIRFTSFYAMPNCSPTRAMLLTGKDSHAVGMGAMAEAIPTAFPFLIGRPGYEGYLRPETTTIAEKFSEAGYYTVMTGKWHLGHKPEQQPSEHGFEQSFVLLDGGGDHFGYGQNDDPALEMVSYTENGELAEYPVGTYSSDFYAARLIDYLSADKGEDRPFFAYLAFTAPHWPLQAPKSLIAKYEGRYSAGPAALRNERLQRMKDLGLLDDATLSANLLPLDDWDTLSEEERAIESRKMEIYAAMVDSLDQNVGKVINHLKQTGQFEDTIIIFMSDNGAEGIDQNQLIRRSANSTPEEFRADILAKIAERNIDLELMGGKDSFLTYGDQWAQAAAAPFKDYKGQTDEGGIRTPAFITGPGIVGERVVGGLLSVRDIMPTALDVANISYDESLTTPSVTIDTVNVPTAKSWVPILSGSADEVRTKNDAMAWELHLQRAIRLGDWKAVFNADDPTGANDPNIQPSWKLYNLKSDAGESQDVRDEHPEVFERLMSAWNAYADENGVFAPSGQSKAE